MDRTLTHCIYALIDPRDDEVRYIGKSVNPERRCAKISAGLNR